MIMLENDELKKLFHETAEEVQDDWNCGGLADAFPSNDPEEGFYECFAWDIFLKMLEKLGMKGEIP